VLIQLLVTLIAGGMFAAALAVGRSAFHRFLRGRSARPPLDAPVPLSWRSLIHARVPLSRRLSPSRREVLLHKTQELVQGCRWEGCGGLLLTEDMRVVIAAHACLLVLEHPGDPYPELDEILVYPGTFQPRRFSWTPAADTGRESPALGESWKHGVVILAWDSAVAGASDPGDGQNVLIHEFAHQLDTTGGPADGTPRLPDATALSSWTTMLERGFERLCREAEAGTQGVLDHYGTTDHAEFFAVATEAFFERPAALQQERPELYDALQRYYRQDPGAPAGVEA
jgi:Mlc titration factor MtfA (ptsG expression regulator)